MCKLRKKLAAASGGTEYVETVWGRGYCLGALRQRRYPADPLFQEVAIAEPVGIGAH